MHDFAIFKGNCPPQEDVALVNSLTYFAHYRHEPELKDKLMDIFIGHQYSSQINELWQSEGFDSD